MEYFNTYLNEISKQCNMLEGELNNINSSISKTENNINSNNEEIELLESSSVLLQEVSSTVKNQAKTYLEQIVTDALRYVHNDNCKFEIEFNSQRGMTNAEFYVVSEINGVTCKQIPQDSCGGGYIDVISTALRYAYNNIYNSPRINNAMILDEPGKLVSEQASVNFAEFIKQLGELFDKQTIMVTHNDSLKGIGDNTISFSKINNKSVVNYYNKGDKDND